MKLGRIFEVIKGRLWVVRYEGESAHIIDQLQDNWTDALWLQDFFEAHKSD